MYFEYKWPHRSSGWYQRRNLRDRLANIYYRLGCLLNLLGIDLRMFLLSYHRMFWDFRGIFRRRCLWRGLCSRSRPVGSRGRRPSRSGLLGCPKLSSGPRTDLERRPRRNRRSSQQQPRTFGLQDLRRWNCCSQWLRHMSGCNYQHSGGRGKWGCRGWCCCLQRWNRGWGRLLRRLLNNSRHKNWQDI